MQQTTPITNAADAPISYTVDRAVKVTGLSRATLYRHSKAGRLPLKKVGSRSLFLASDLRRLIDGEAA